jgi:hypothetical protein
MSLFILVYLTTLCVSQIIQCSMIGQWIMVREGFGRKRPWTNLRYYLGICLRVLRKNTKMWVRIAGVPVYICAMLFAYRLNRHARSWTAMFIGKKTTSITIFFSQWQQTFQVQTLMNNWTRLVLISSFFCHGEPYVPMSGYLLTYLRSRALLEKLPIVQLLKNFPAF